MIKNFFKRIKVFFRKKKQFKEVSMVCANPIFIRYVGYVPCCRCSRCKDFMFLAKTKEELEKLNPERKWQIVY